MTKLIALAAIAAGVLSTDSPEVLEGQSFEADPTVAETLLTEGKAKLAEPTPSEASKPQKAAKRIKVRLLVDSPYGNCNDVVELEPADAKAAEAAGLADPGKEAVAYALTLEQNKA